MADDRMKNDDVQRNMGGTSGREGQGQQSPGRTGQGGQQSGQQAGGQKGAHEGGFGGQKGTNVDDDDDEFATGGGGQGGGMNRGGQNR